MGKISIEHPVYIDYIPEFVDMWNTLTNDEKNTFNEFGRPYGYTGMNVLYISVEIYGSLVLGGADVNKYFFERLE